jgi:CDP-diacylglycerol---glycerol-3-phosphate 3-phosphatidyltransferase
VNDRLPEPAQPGEDRAGGSVEVPPGPAPASAPAEPPWYNPANLLTILRVLLVPVIGYLLVLDDDVARWWAFGIFLFAAWTDSIDGWLARRMVGVTRWGQLADPLADKALIVGTLAVLAWIGPLPWWAVGIIILREVAVTVQRTLLLRRDLVMSASVFGKAKTLSQICAITLYLLPGSPHGLRLAALWVAVGITVFSGVEYAFRGRRLQRAS